MSSTISHAHSASSPPKPARRSLPRSPSDPVHISGQDDEAPEAPTPQQIYVLSADGSRLFLLDPSKPANEEPPPYAPFHPSPSSGHISSRSLSSTNVRNSEPGPSSPRRSIQGLISPQRHGQAGLLLPDEDHLTRHRAGTLSTLVHNSPSRPRMQGIASRPPIRSAASSPGISHRLRIADETTPLLGDERETVGAGTGPSRGTWRSLFCGDLDEGEADISTWTVGWKRYWRPWSRKLYWKAAFHLIVLNFPFALLIWPWLVVGTLAGTALLITLPIGAAVWWVTLFLSRSSARLETIMQLRYHSPIDPSVPEPTYHPIFYRVKERSAPTSPISPIDEFPPQLQWETRFVKCSYAMFADHYSYSALSYFLLIKPLITLFSTILIVALFPVCLALFFLMPIYLRVIRRWGRWQAGIAIGNLDTAGFRAKHRAEHYSRSAAAAAHASYYAHPSLHLHTYIPKHFRHDNDDPHREGQKVGPKDGPHDPTAPSAVDPSKQPNEKDKPQTGTEGTREELGGKQDAGDPSGEGNDALAKQGKAQGTVSSPGPSAQEVAEYYSKSNGQMNGAAEEVERPGIEKFWKASARMEPHLQLLCGPLLAYYTVKDGIYQGAAMVVCNDEGSVYSPAPTLALSYHPYSAPNDANPSLADVETNLLGPSTVQATKFHSYVPADGSSSVSFFRFLYEIPLQQVEMTVKYRLNGGPALSFVVPAQGQNLRWAAHSCNGFSSGVNPDEFKGSYESGYDPLWEDMVLKHHTQPLHCMVGGGDQIYCDAITREPELQSWINAPTRESKLGHPLTDEMKHCVDRFYFNHYCKIFRSNAFGRANASIPMVNMLDDHDLIDGFGTYDDETQAAAVLSFIGSRGYFWFLIFQLFTNDQVDGTNPQVGTHPIKSMIIGNKGAWIPFPSHSLLVYLGPKVLMLALDCRAERKLHQICTKETYAKTFGEVRKHKGIEQLVFLLGVPIAYPRMSFLEHFLEARWNPLNILARKGALGLGGMVNKFNKSAELLDDLNDHWCANVHKKERNWLVLECQKLVLEMNARLTFLSGDVHLAAVGCLFTHKTSLSGKKVTPEEDYRYMLNVVTSAIVNTPPPPVPAGMVAKLGGHKHRTLPHHTDEMMVPLFTRDTDGSSMRQHLVQARRNYAIVSYLQTGELEFDFRVEKFQGAGETVSYAVKAPAPRWQAAA